MPTASMCPKCREMGVVLENYESLIMVSPDRALFTVTCRACGARISSVSEIPDSLREEIQSAAIEVGAGMGRDR